MPYKGECGLNNNFIYTSTHTKYSYKVVKMGFWTLGRVIGAVAILGGLIFLQTNGFDIFNMIIKGISGFINNPQIEGEHIFYLLIAGIVGYYIFKKIF
jgi:hypothetical protein